MIKLPKEVKIKLLLAILELKSFLMMIVKQV